MSEWLYVQLLFRNPNGCSGHIWGGVVSHFLGLRDLGPSWLFSRAWPHIAGDCCKLLIRGFLLSLSRLSGSIYY
mgnify:CR=1 FL=1